MDKSYAVKFTYVSVCVCRCVVQCRVVYCSVAYVRYYDVIIEYVGRWSIAQQTAVKYDIPFIISNVK